MRGRRRTGWLAVVASTATLMTLGLPAAAAPPAAGRAAAAPAVPAGSGPTTKVIVVLRDRSAGLAARSAARASSVRTEEAPVAATLRSAGIRHVVTGRALPIVIASVTPAQRAALAADPAVATVVPDSVIPNPAPQLSGADGFARVPGTRTTPANTPAPCGTATAPEADPEAADVIKAPAAAALGYDGAGVTVAYIADGVNPANPDFSRNPAYASAGSPAGSPVLTQQDFTGDPSGTPTAGGEAFIDSSSIAAQGNQVYNLNDFVNPAHPLPQNPCDIKITGTAPGASVLGLKVFSENQDTTESNFLQAIDYAVANGVQVINESFGSNNFPDTALDVTRLADDAAVAAGVTVVVSSGDSGITSTTGSPATDPNVISVGATTTFRAYEQLTYGGTNDPKANGTWIDNNISSLSSGGFAQNGSTVDLVAPGDLNWALCDPNAMLFTDCTDYQSPPTGASISLAGGTSESAPLTAGAAADVIQAYASTHGGTDPSPALVKQILVSTATDIHAPADQQGAGLLNVLAAVKEAASLAGSSATPSGGLLVSPNQINVTQNPGDSHLTPVRLTNTGSQPLTVALSTRALTHQVADQSGSFCLNPSATDISCGPPTTSSFPIWSGVTEVYQEQRFTVPAMTSPSRLNFSADYANTGQTSLLHVALIDPTGAYAGYSLPQGLGDYANVQVADPAAGTWTAVFFTAQDDATSGAVGTSGTIQWDANSSRFARAGIVVPSSLTIQPGRTRTALFIATSNGEAGDRAQSIVLADAAGTTTIPVTVRTVVPIGPSGGTFRGVLTGGNGRGNPAASNTYDFTVPAGERDLDVSAAFTDGGDGVVAFLVDPEGQAVASSSSVTANSTGTSVIGTPDVNVYKDNPQPGKWSLVLDWLQPVSGAELSEPFSGAVRFNRVRASADLPQQPSVSLAAGHTYTFAVTVRNTGLSPQAIFLDPRSAANATVPLADLNGSAQNMTLPLPAGTSFPIYQVPTDTRGLVSGLTGTAPVTYDLGYFTGDPDLSPAVPAPGVSGSQSGNSAGLTWTIPGGVAPGYWYLNPSEIGPYPAAGAPAVTASAAVAALTKGFDLSVTPSTGDLWTADNGLSTAFSPVYLEPGQSASIPLTITPSAAPGSRVSGFVAVDDAFQVNELVGATNTGGDELAALPFSYRVVSTGAARGR